MSTNVTNISIDSPSVTVLLGRITEEIGDSRLSELIRHMLAQAFERAEASKNEAIEKAMRLDVDRASLEEKRKELDAEQSALQEEQQALYDATSSLKDLPCRVQDLSEALNQLITGLEEERQAAQ